MNVLVTGAAGYVGSVCAAELLRRRHLVVAYDDLSAGHREALAPGLVFVRGDVADTDRLKHACRKYRIEAVMHFAASALVDASVRDPHLFFRNNVSGGVALLGALIELGIRKLIFSSSAAVYGEPQRVPIPEEHHTAPVNAYGETKLALERALAWYQRAYGLECVALRYFNAAGATRLHGEDHRPETHILPRLLEAARNPEIIFSIFGDDYPTRDGTCVRDYVHVVDIARAHILALEKLGKIKYGIYNIGHGKGYSIREVIRNVEKVLGRTLPVRVGPRRAGDPAVLVADPRKILRELGWHPILSDLTTIVKSAWRWRRRYPNGYGPAGRAKG